MSAAELPSFSTGRFRAEREADWIAFDLLLTIAPDGPQAPEIRLLMGNLQVRQGQWDEATRAFTAHEPDILFLDIQMPGMTGLEVARLASGKCHVVFVTAFDRYAVAAFERVRGACIVVDFGTATTFDVVSPKGEYLGGVIAPGPRRGRAGAAPGPRRAAPSPSSGTRARARPRSST